MYDEQVRWIAAPPAFKLNCAFLKAQRYRQLPDGKALFRISLPKSTEIVTADISYEVSNGKDYPDMCHMDHLSEPQILANMLKRYHRDQIFTWIGPTLIAINPYKHVQSLSGKQTLQSLRRDIFTHNLTECAPHVYSLAAQAYSCMLQTNKKQAIVISGESGAGKTQSTKYCLQMLTSMNEHGSQSIERKIIACNPLLEAFGNSKTVKNDNSSRFGKFVRIYFGAEKSIKGAQISSYLLEKSRVVSLSQNQRSFHAFYALAASAQYGMKEPAAYAYLRQSNCFTVSNVDDKQYFHLINQSMKAIGFTTHEKDTIWNVLSSILLLGNIDFDDHSQYSNQSEACLISNSHDLAKVAEILKVEISYLEKVLLFQRKKFLKEFTLSAYSKVSCRNNRNALSKAMYNSIFEFILSKIQESLRPNQSSLYSQINILDIFGFENFESNSFEQLCINFTNEKLSRLYHAYVFDRQMQILKQDGLEEQVANIQYPSNCSIIDLMSGKLSLFSIINDLTLPTQFKDEDIIHGFRAKFKSPALVFDKINKNMFTLKHTQSSVCYSAIGFKGKNQDKVSQEVQDMVGGLFSCPNLQTGNTILFKFQREIDDLMAELDSSQVHFLRCIKPNDHKAPNSPDELYILAQMRYLSVFQTILIRKKTFPVRRAFADFAKQYRQIFSAIRDNDERALTLKILRTITKDNTQYLLGKTRVYMSKQVETQLQMEMLRFMELRNEKVKILQKSLKKVQQRRTICKKLKLLVRRIGLLRKFPLIISNWACRSPFSLLKQETVRRHQAKERQKEQQRISVMIEVKKMREQEQKLLQRNKLSQKQSKRANAIEIIAKSAQKRQLFISFQKILSTCTQIQIEINDSMSLIEQMNETSRVGDQVISEKRQIYNQQSTSRAASKEYQFKEQLIVEMQSHKAVTQHIIFKDGIILPEKTASNLEKLTRIICEESSKDTVSKSEDYQSPKSDDFLFTVSKIPADILQKIMNFQIQKFFNGILRKRTTFMGKKKSYAQILVAKQKFLTKSMTILDDETEHAKALKIFSIFLKIAQEPKIDVIITFHEEFLANCKDGSAQLHNEVFVQLIRQSNVNREMQGVRMYQTLLILIHMFSFPEDYILALLQILFFRVTQDCVESIQNSFACCLMSKLCRKLVRNNRIMYIPLDYQLMGILCQRKVSILIYLSAGSSVVYNLESYDTFGSIKARVMEQFGITVERFPPEMFIFCEIVSYQHEDIEETSFKETSVIWDFLTYCDITKKSYIEKGIQPPKFYVILKLRYAFQLRPTDKQGVLLCYSQCLLDYFLGRLAFPVPKMGRLAAIIRRIKYPLQPISQIYIGTVPLELSKSVPKEKMMRLIEDCSVELQQRKLSTQELKYQFLEIVNESPLAMATAIATNQPVGLAIKPRAIYLYKHGSVLEEFPLKHVLKWWAEPESFNFVFQKGANDGPKTHVIFTSYGVVCNEYLNTLSTHQFKLTPKH